ncbi:hypothetical protein SAMN04515667_2297 [Formosa sp. Hel1_31_208]|uniref:hypothetical protein n=1 Tax=Formosa sp. Hel1_31_208 TaxID=1798225 RepID=UPI00087D5B76|nr:hypothetical protein [Formosa sp. Hel1_31_208]SDS49251.1 hypothetical protein SAMN04515667_2297 [Formosa sp. Hel1_31_208]
MKKLGSIILGFIIGVGGMYYYTQYYGEPAVTDALAPMTPKGIVKPNEIKSLTQAYNSRYDTISSVFFRGVEGGDNRSSWYSLTDLENYLELAANQAEDLGYTMDGVRLYLGAHPAVKNAPGYTTILFVPTGTKNMSEGNMLYLNYQVGSPDIPGGDGLDHGSNGIPPSANYPQ